MRSGVPTQTRGVPTGDTKAGCYNIPYHRVDSLPVFTKAQMSCLVVLLKHIASDRARVHASLNLCTLSGLRYSKRAGWSCSSGLRRHCGRGHFRPHLCYGGRGENCRRHCRLRRCRGRGENVSGSRSCPVPRRRSRDADANVTPPLGRFLVANNKGQTVLSSVANESGSATETLPLRYPTGRAGSGANRSPLDCASAAAPKVGDVSFS